MIQRPTAGRPVTTPGTTMWDSGGDPAAISDLAQRLPALPAHASTLVEGVHGALGAAITEGYLPAGHRLRESDLATHFGCSTTPIREALRRLENEGLVRIFPRRRAEVTGLDTGQVRHLFDARLALEPFAIRRAVERCPSEAELASVEEVLRRQDQGGDQPLGADFHSALLELSANPVIVELVLHATRQIEAVQGRINGQHSRRRPESHRAHRDLLTAVRNGDPDAAEALMREHLEWARDAVLAALRKDSA